MCSAALKNFYMHVVGSHILLTLCAADTLMHREGTNPTVLTPLSTQKKKKKKKTSSLGAERLLKNKYQS